jgi:multimeric flavodoxin WrbA
MKTILIVFHSFTGGARQMAEAAAAGAASEPGINIRLQHAADCNPPDLLDSSGYIFATPENLGAMAGMMKDFFDRNYYPVLGRIVGRPYVALVCAGSDGENAARQIERITVGWRLRTIAPPVIVCTYAQTPEEIMRPKQIGEYDLGRCRDAGATMAAGLAFEMF